jgi:hypothetical protein
MTASRLLFLSLLGVYAATAWVIVDRVGPHLQRTWPSVGSVEGGFLEFGGVHDNFSNNNYTYYNDIYYFSNVIQRYILLEPIGEVPSPRAFSSGVGDGLQCLYIYGGANYPATLFPAHIYGDMWRYCVLSDHWELLPQNNAGPGNRTGSSLHFFNNKIYLFAGLDASFLGHNDIWEYDVATGMWTEISPDIPAGSVTPAPDQQHLPIWQFYEGNFYAGYGERGIQYGFGFATGLWKFNLASRTWTMLAPNPDLTPTRNYVGNVIYGSHIIVMGGDTPSSNPPCCGAPFPQNPTNQTAVYSITENAWGVVNTPLPDIPNLKRHRLVINGDQIHSVGGWGWIQNVGQVWNPNVYLASASDLVANAHY